MVGCSECHTDFCRSRLSAFTVKNGEFFTKICGGLEFKKLLSIPKYSSSRLNKS